MTESQALDDLRAKIHGRVAADTAEDWHVVTDTGTPDDFGDAVRYVEAAANGTRYVVVATRLPEGHHEGGPVLVTVVQPWQAAKVMADRGYLHEGYVAEHLTPHLRPPGAGVEDLTALTLTVRHALDRTQES